MRNGRKVTGRLGKRVEKWREFGASPLIISWISEGVWIVDRDVLPIKKGKNVNRWRNQEEVAWTEKEIQRLLEIGAISEVDSEPDVLSPIFLIPKAGPKKFRLVIDMREMNRSFDKRSFKLENLIQIGDMVEEGMWMFSLDLEDGYHHVLLNRRIRGKFGFYFKGRWFVFNVLPFGWTLSPWIFTKIGKVLLKRWRALGILVVIYMDDFWVAAKSKEEALLIRDETIVPDIQSLGWVISLRKSHLEPTQEIEILGLVINSREMKFSIPSAKRKSLIRALIQLKSRLLWKRVSARELASVAGKLMATKLAFPQVRLLTREMYALIGRRWEMTWDWRIWPSAQLFIDIGEMIEILKTNPKGRIGRAATTSMITIRSDASATGWGGFMWKGGSRIEALGFWKEGENLLSSTWRELKGIQRTLMALQPWLIGGRVSWKGDSAGGKDVWNNWGSSKRHLTQIIREIWKWSLENGVILEEATWTSRNLNQRADWLSKWSTLGEWEVQEWVVQWVEENWGLPDIDRFATWENTKYQRFNSMAENPGTEGKNAFAQDWTGTLSWVVPPLALVGRTLALIVEQRVWAVIMVPVWEAQPWWPVLRRIKVEARELGAAGECLEDAPLGGAEVFANPAWRFQVVLVNGNLSHRRS